MTEIIKTMILVLKIGGLGCLILVVAIVLVILAICLTSVISSVIGK